MDVDTPGVLKGLGSSTVSVKGTARVVIDPTNPPENRDDMILIARETDPGWLFLMLAPQKVQTVFREWEKMIEELIIQSGIDAGLAHTASVSLISFFEGLGIYSVMLSMQPDELPQVLDNYKQQIKELLNIES